jgi:hypothetical protein
VATMMAYFFENDKGLRIDLMQLNEFILNFDTYETKVFLFGQGDSNVFSFAKKTAGDNVLK